MNEAYAVTTRIDGAVITTDIENTFGGVREQIIQQVLDTREKQVRQALIQLGWTPPPTETQRA